jgi:hypothetical protein
MESSKGTADRVELFSELFIIDLNYDKAATRLAGLRASLVSSTVF